jgi:hypothetical protein
MVKFSNSKSIHYDLDGNVVAVSHALRVEKVRKQH